MRTLEIRKDIHWVGAVDWDVRDFHGYSTPKGTTYNAYLATDEKTALFDTVKAPFADCLLKNIGCITNPEKIDYIIVNHVEMDHSGALPAIIEACKPEKVFCSPNGKKALLDHFHREDWPFEVVKSGDTISLGSMTVNFLETRMLHWPDSMFSYIKERTLLISSDAFGQHWATSERFDDEVDSAELVRHAAKYYANILLPFSPLVQKLIADVKNLGIKIDMIAPDHGLIWRADPGGIVSLYDSWSRQEAIPKAVVVYDTMWHSTEKMAFAIADGLLRHNVRVKMMNLRYCHRSDVVTEALDAKAILFGCSTLNGGILPRMADMLTYIKGLKPANKFGAAFGSYGWSGEAAKIIAEQLKEMKFELVDPVHRVRYVPSCDDLAQCVELGDKVGLEIKNGHG